MFGEKVSKMSENPLVTIIIPTYKGDWKLCRAIKSCLSQTYKSIEIIVVDDNGEGTEGQLQTATLMQTFEHDSRVIYIKHDVNKNGASARNTGINASHGVYLAFLDDDDIYREDRIEACVNKIAKSGLDNSAVYVGVTTVVAGNCVGKCMPMVEGNICDALLVDQGLLGSGSNIFIPKWVAKKIDGFDISFRRFQDVEFMVRASKYLYMLPIKECMIIKDNTNVRFVPNYFGLKEATFLFLQKFHDQIESFDKSKEAIFNKYVFLMLYACKCKEKSAINESRRLLNGLSVDKKRLLKITIKGKMLKYSDSRLYRLYKKVSDKRKDKKIRNSLNKEELEFLDKVNSTKESI